MMDDTGPTADLLITGAEIARLAGVTRAAVSNWRRRYDDFPTPASGAANSPLFNLAEVRSWLARQRKGQDVAEEVQLWQALRGVYGDDMVSGLVALGQLFTQDAPPPGLAPEIAQRGLALAGETSKAEVLTALTERFLDATRRAGSDQVSSLRIVRAVRHFAGSVPETARVLDPACGIGSLLLALGPAAGPSRHGQEIDPAMAELTRLRAALTGCTPTEIRSGDSLRDDRWGGLKADLVVCDPPVGSPDWGREDLILDARWELGVPSRAEGELAWLQHAYAHTSPGGRTVMVMPPSVAYRKAGRRIRAELVRRGILTQVVALPAGTATGHALPVHLWLLDRPDGAPATTVRMVDLSSNAPDDPFDPAPDQVVDVPLIDLLDDTVDLTPGNHTGGSTRDYAADYSALRSQLQDQLRAIGDLLPRLGPGDGAGALDSASVSIADLTRAGLVEHPEDGPVSASDQLDTDYLRGFLAGPANRRRSTSASGTFRVDTRGSRIPQMGIEDQRRYGAAFRALQEFDEGVRTLARIGEQAASLAREGLTNGGLCPPPVTGA
ncbi:N-6 DNA methylase [Kitasatospora viridis]|uniref:N-6 DNA methylase n=1 Tax=Kitasatospora viridis TaxID=281105 RepID=A0A561UNH4_9ACTN|nr:N-6 DNA methylase [Kitasatospora viridis]TWG00884.1 N-6 DNA methylase [Kitasatospora viridis]